jgi:PelA/Pel-15E family pectate lyase
MRSSLSVCETLTARSMGHKKHKVRRAIEARKAPIGARAICVGRTRPFVFFVAKWFGAILGSLALTLTAAEPISRDEAAAALRRAATYFSTHAAAHGGYVYFCALDLQQRWGEGAATKDQIFVQPPGTPAVGDAFLRAYAATGERLYLDAARAAGGALAYGQLKSGGWAQVIDFDPKGSKAGLYRNGRSQGRNHTSLDDNQTQAALQFMARLDRALGFADTTIHDAARYALDALLAAQFANGAFPQGFTGPVTTQPVMQASYPADWPRTWPNPKYWDYYTLNDGIAGTVAETLLVAHEVYRDERTLAALKRLGDFLILAQMPDPQPAWAQQYSYEMHPMWARRFEPPAIAGLESEDAIATLLKIHRATGDASYLAPLPRAIAYLKTCVLPDGRMARYRELRTNRPLYMNRRGQDYFLTFDDTDLPAHYGWKQPTRIAALEREFAAAQAGSEGRSPLAGEFAAGSPSDAAKLATAAREAIRTLDAEGRWVSTYAGERLVGQPKFAAGFRYLDSGVFIERAEALAAYLAATRPE